LSIKNCLSVLVLLQHPVISVTHQTLVRVFCSVESLHSDLIFESLPFFIGVIMVASVKIFVPHANFTEVIIMYVDREIRLRIKILLLSLFDLFVT
jgi:hypothetical protein